MNSKKTEDLFFEILQVAVGNRSSLSFTPSAEQWAEVFALSKKQALVAVAFRGVCRFNCSSDYGASLGIDEVTYLKWLGMTAKVAQRNKVVSEACKELTELLEKDGFFSCVLKGQSNLVNYPEELRDCRTPGDIDIWMMPKENGLGGVMESLNVRRKRIVAYVKQKSGEQHVLYHHVDLPMESPVGDQSRTIGVDVEAHFTPSWMKSPWHNARVQRFFEDEWYNIEKVSDGFCVPSAKMNVVYQLMHIYRHLFCEGIGLRQILDFYFVVKALHDAQRDYSDRTSSMGQWVEAMGRGVPSNEEICRLLKRFGLYRFAGSLMWVLQKVFAMQSEYLICNPCADSGNFLLSEIMEAGNFGKFDKRTDGEYASSSFSHVLYKAKRNLRLFTFFPSEVIWAPYFYYVQNWGSWRRDLR